MCFDETFTRQFDIAKELCIYLTGNICLIHRRIYISLRLCSWILSGWIIPWNELFQFSLCIFELYSRGIILSYFYFYYSILNNLMYTYIYMFHQSIISKPRWTTKFIFISSLIESPSSHLYKIFPVRNLLENRVPRDSSLREKDNERSKGRRRGRES